MWSLFIVSLTIFLVGFNSLVIATDSQRDRKFSFPYPKEWSRARVVAPPRSTLRAKATQSQEVPLYLVQYMYHWGTNCQGKPDRTESNAFGACLGGIDEDGNPTTSYSSVFVGVNGSTVTYLSNTYLSTDCSGTPKWSYTYNQPLNSCVADAMYVITDGTNPEPWVGETDGVIVKTYPLSPDGTITCTGYPEVYQSVSFNYCMGYYDAANPTVTNVRYTACDSDKDTVTYSMYQNYSCNDEDIIKTVTFSGSSCRVCPSSSDGDSSNCYPQGFWYRNYESISCNSLNEKKLN